MTPKEKILACAGHLTVHSIARVVDVSHCLRLCSFKTKRANCTL